MFGNRRVRVTANTVLMILTLFCLIPFLLIVISSVTDETTLIRDGYSFLPNKFGLDSYLYLWNHSSAILRAYGITVLVAVVGTSMSMLFTMFMAYPLSVPDLPHRKILSFFVYFTMLFNGGVVPTYIIWTRVLGLKNTIWALIFPYLLVRAFYVLMMRSYFTNNIPQSILESARIDGAKEFYIFFRIVIPISLPMVASLGLLIGLGYWNDWINGLYFITDSKLFSIQNLLNRMLKEIQFLASGAGSTEGMGMLPSVGIRMAIAVIGVLPIMVIYPFIQRYLVKGMVMGAIKG